MIWYLLLYFPLCLVCVAVIEACKEDDVRVVAKKTLKNFLSFTGILVLLAIVSFILQKYA